MTDTPHVCDGPCPSCETGTMKTVLFQNYQTKYKGYPFTVPQAYIGVCDTCDERAFSPRETERWNAYFLEQLEEKKAFLSPAEITRLREELGLTKKDFALLIGVTARSLQEWEKVDQANPASRSADLIMKLIRASLRSSGVDVLSVLLTELEKWGVALQVRRPVPEPEPA